MVGLSRKAGLALAVLGASALAGCSSPGAGGSTPGNMVLFAGPTVPPPAKTTIADVYCPAIEIPEGGSSIQAFSGGRVGDQGALRSQIALGQIARECIGNPTAPPPSGSGSRAARSSGRAVRPAATMCLSTSW